MADRFLIAPYNENSGLQRNVKPWLLPDQAFATLNDMYTFRERNRKRPGTTWFGNNQFVSRLRIDMGNIVKLDAPSPYWGLAGNVATITVSGITGAVGQSFFVTNGTDTVMFTVINSSPGANQMLRTDGAPNTATYDIGTTDFDIEFPTNAFLGATLYFFPGLPVMGLPTFENNDFQNNFLIGFDTKFAYQYTNGWERLEAEADTGAATWTGNDAQFFWTTSWTGADASEKLFFVTNFKQDEPNFMRYYSAADGMWHNYRPEITDNSGNPIYLFSSQLLVVFKNRLVALNTWEGTLDMSGAIATNINYNNRARYSWIGSPIDTNAFRQDLSPISTNSIDASTTESIISCEFVKDRLIVYFERSAWELVYTGNATQPFTWQKINTELGAESPFSIVPFDKVALGIANYGVHACSGANVERIDIKIPDEVFDIHNGSDGALRVYGIRDYFTETVYWTFPATDSNDTFPYPRRILVYNYRNNTWAFFNDSITAFGYYQPSQGVLWSSTIVTWSSDESWNSGAFQSQFRRVCAGNQQGYTFVFDIGETTNASVLQITDIEPSDTTYIEFTVIQHNLRVSDFIYIENCVWRDASNALNKQIFKVSNVIDANTFRIAPDASQYPTAAYRGGGVISRVAKPDIVTKEYNFYADKGKNAAVQRVDFHVDTTDAGQMTVNFLLSTSTYPVLQQSIDDMIILGTSVLDTFAYTAANAARGVKVPIQFEEFSKRLWHPVYFQAEGEFIQFQLTLSDEQMMNTDIREADFQLHAMLITATPTSDRLQ